MIGELVPAALLPRFVSYVGPGTYTTAPLDVQAFLEGHFVFWRGPLVGGAATNPFRTYFEESHDAFTWTEATATLMQPITTVNRSDPVSVQFRKRWLRVRVELLADANGVVGITLWLTGGLERRVADA